MKQIIRVNLQSGLTLLEILIVIGVIGVVLTIITEIFYRSVKITLRTQMINTLKQNGQFTIDNIDKIIRGTEVVVCPTVAPGVNMTSTSDSIVVFKQGVYTRFKYNPSTYSGSISYNGYISQDSERDCTSASPPTEKILTDTDKTKGVSISATSMFTRNSTTGYKDSIMISFTVEPAKEAPKSVVSQVNSVQFNTTVTLR